MANLKSVQSQQSSLTSLEHFVQAYQEVTVYQMQRVRDAVLNNRIFMNGLLDIFIDIKQAQQKAEVKRLKEAGATQFSFSTLVKNGKSALVFLSLDSRFAGNSTRAVFNLFAKYLEAHQDGDIIIVGALGKRLFNARFPQIRNYTYYELPENVIGEQLTALTKDLLQYQNVDVFTSYFHSLLEQDPVQINITAAIPLDEQSSLLERQQRFFLFEPAGPEIMNFFEVQIFTALLRQTVEETRLATLGNRISTLESTYSTLEDQLSKLNKAARKAKRKEMNKKQRQRMAGMALW